MSCTPPKTFRCTVGATDRDITRSLATSHPIRRSRPSSCRRTSGSGISTNQDSLVVSDACRTDLRIRLFAGLRKCDQTNIRLRQRYFVLSPILFLIFASAKGQVSTEAPQMSLPTVAPVTAPPSSTDSPTQPPIDVSPTVGIPSTYVPTSRPSLRPTWRPTIIPTNVPTATEMPSAVPSVSSEPTLSMMPSLEPSLSFEPSLGPTMSWAPTGSPSAEPTLSYQPTDFPTETLSDFPSYVPSLPPSELPTSVELSRRRGFYQHEFIMPENYTFFNVSELTDLAKLFSGYTYGFAPKEAREVSTECSTNLRDQQKFTIQGTNTARLILLYSCLYTSRRFRVTNYPDLYVVFVGENLPEVTADVQVFIPRLVETGEVVSFETSTEAPTLSEAPSPAPSYLPSWSLSPSEFPSLEPSSQPVIAVSPTIQPTTEFPSPPPTHSPTKSPVVPVGESSSAPVGIIAGVVIAVGVVCLGALFCYYYYVRKQQRREESSRNSVLRNPDDRKELPIRRLDDRVVLGASGAVSPNESIVSHKSLLSRGESGYADESGDENDGTKNLQDEFDQFRDQTLEQFRSNVEGNLSGFEGIMSAAVTKALMGDDDADIDPAVLLWGCPPDPSPAEIEASALCEVNDWLKRNEASSNERKRVFMKDIINRMLTTTRFGYLRAEDASRTVHESAALLGLPLANELPMTTVVFGGMRKTIGASDMVKVLREFGDIDVAAVASGQRGFGVVRFRNSKSVEKAMRRYRDGEIVIQDVAVQMKVLQTNGAVES